MRKLGIVLLIAGVLIGFAGTLYSKASAFQGGAAVQPQVRQAMLSTGVGAIVAGVGGVLTLLSILRPPGSKRNISN
jgi:hypothetical protein